MTEKIKEKYLIGIDVGSTTTKIAVVDEKTGKMLYSDYQRHHADQLRSVYRALARLEPDYFKKSFGLC